MTALTTFNTNQAQAQKIVNQNFNPAWQSLVNPQLAAYGDQQRSQIASLQQQLGLGQAQYGVEKGMKEWESGLSGRRLNLNEQELGDQRNALGRQVNEYLPQQQALANQGFDLQGKQNLFGTQQNIRGLTSDATARGALQNQGTRQGFADIYAQMAYATEGLGIERKGSDLSFKQQRDKAADDEKQLNRAAESLGLDREELTKRTEYAINQLGLQNALSSQDIIMALNDASSGKDNPLWGILPQIYQLTGIRPTASASAAKPKTQNTAISKYDPKSGTTAIGGGMRRF